MRLASRWTNASLVVAALLYGCGGGESESGNSGRGGSSIPVTTSATSTITGATPIITLPDVATVDFSGQTLLMGKSVTLATVTEASLNDLARTEQDFLEVDLSAPQTIQITTPIGVTGSVTVTVFAAKAIATAGIDQAVTVYAYSFVGEADDGGDAIHPLPAIVDSQTGTIVVNVPWPYFQPTPAGTYVANLKIGVATASTSPAPTAARATLALKGATATQSTTAAVAGAVSTIKIPCPLPVANGCIETSRYNPLRFIPPYPNVGHHGADFRAQTPLEITVPAGLAISTRERPRKYEDDVTQVVATLAGLPKTINNIPTPCPDSNTNINTLNAAVTNGLLTAILLDSLKKRCKRINRGAGITLTLTEKDYKIRLLHLSALHPSIYDAQRDIFIQGVTQGGTPVALTGRTGAAIDGPHLHLDVFQNNTGVCGHGNVNCKYVVGRTDPFPFFATELELVANKRSLKSGDAYNFIFTATDVSKTSVSSEVGSPGEGGGLPPLNALQTPNFRYDPTRKVCLSQSNSIGINAIAFAPAPDSTTVFSGPNVSPSTTPSYCAAWGTFFKAFALLDGPLTMVTAKYSSDPAVAVALDPLSSAFATLDLAAHITAIADQRPQNLVVGTPIGSFSPLINVSGGVPPYTFSKNGTLPLGLMWNSATGIVSGTPTAAFPTNSVTFSVSDSTGVVASTTSTVSFTVNFGYFVSATRDETVQPFIIGGLVPDFAPLINVAGGVPPYTFSYSGQLPTGLVLNSSTGIVSGTPIDAKSSSTVTFSVADSNGVISATRSSVLYHFFSEFGADLASRSFTELPPIYPPGGGLPTCVHDLSVSGTAGGPEGTVFSVHPVNLNELNCGSWTLEPSPFGQVACKRLPGAPAATTIHIREIAHSAGSSGIGISWVIGQGRSGRVNFDDIKPPSACW